MNNQTLVIYDFEILYEILKELESHVNFNLLCIKKKSKFNFKELDNYLVISDKKLDDFKNQILISQFPINISKLIESINIKFLQKKYNQQSEINLGIYKLNLNSRKIFDSEKDLDLTEKEADIIIFLKNSKEPVSINELQTNVWGHSSKLETHTVETHIYRLRKKISNKFGNTDFILSTKSGYNIK